MTTNSIYTVLPPPRKHCIAPGCRNKPNAATRTLELCYNHTRRQLLYGHTAASLVERKNDEWHRLATHALWVRYNRWVPDTRTPFNLLVAEAKELVRQKRSRLKQDAAETILDLVTPGKCRFSRSGQRPDRYLAVQLLRLEALDRLATGVFPTRRAKTHAVANVVRRVVKLHEVVEIEKSGRVRRRMNGIPNARLMRTLGEWLQRIYDPYLGNWFPLVVKAHARGAFKAHRRQNTPARRAVWRVYQQRRAAFLTLWHRLPETMRPNYLDWLREMKSKYPWPTVPKL